MSWEPQEQQAQSFCVKCSGRAACKDALKITYSFLMREHRAIISRVSLGMRVPDCGSQSSDDGPRLYDVGYVWE